MTLNLQTLLFTPILTLYSQHKSLPTTSLTELKSTFWITCKVDAQREDIMLCNKQKEKHINNKTADVKLLQIVESLLNSVPNEEKTNIRLG